MRWWWRRRAYVGTYKHPPIVPLASVERVVEEGMLISALAVRMSIKNSLIVEALRDRLDYDYDYIALVTREQLMLLALENEATAERLDHTERQSDHAAAPADDVPDEYETLREEDHRRRPSVHRQLAAALRREADDPAAVAALVAQARVEATDEIGGEALRQLLHHDFGSEAGYAHDREKRIRSLIAIDIAKLKSPDGRG